MNGFAANSLCSHARVGYSEIPFFDDFQGAQRSFFDITDNKPLHF